MNRHWADVVQHIADQTPRSGYFKGKDLAETGAFASLLIRHLADLPSRDDLTIRIISASTEVPQESRDQYTQMHALSRARSRLRDLARDQLAPSGACTIFAKTLTVMSVEPLSNRPSDDEEICHVLPHWAGAVHLRVRLPATDHGHALARRIMLGGWAAAVASALRRKAVGPADCSASKVLAATFTTSRHTPPNGALKALTTPTWRTDPSELLHDPRTVAASGNDLHFPELISEGIGRSRLTTAVSVGSGTLAVSDVHGLFDGHPSGPLFPKPWPGIRGLFEQLHASIPPSRRQSSLLSSSLNLRLSVARRLRRTLALIASTRGVSDCTFLRGDGATFVLPPGTSWDRNQSSVYARTHNALPFGVGATTIRSGEPFAEALARAECALALTKIAPNASIYHGYMHFDEPLNKSVRSAIADAHDRISRRDLSDQPKHVIGLAPYIDLVEDLL